MPFLYEASLSLLSPGHPALTAEGGVVDGIEKLGISPHQDTDIIGEVLGVAEGFKAIVAKGFLVV
jgi:hypothetical protein